jgi:biotin operon repressor
LIELGISKDALEKNISLAREKGIRIPTFAHMKIPAESLGIQE